MVNLNDADISNQNTVENDPIQNDAKEIIDPAETSTLTESSSHKSKPKSKHSVSISRSSKKSQESLDKKLRILSLGGGGVKVLVTVKILKRLEDLHHNNTSYCHSFRSIIDSVDVFAGTSAGGILALMLAMGKSLDYVERFLETNISRVFQQSTQNRIKNLQFTFGPKYSNENLRELLVEEFGENLRLGDVPRTVFITAFDTQGRSGQKAYFDREEKGFSEEQFTQQPRQFSQVVPEHRKLKVVDVLMRTSAAPIYFPIYQGFIDGGVFANQPSMFALIELLQNKHFLTSQPNAKLNTTLLLSLTTGESQESLSSSDSFAKWGQDQQVKNDRLLEILFDSMKDTTNSECRALLGNNYRFINPRLITQIKLDEYEKLDDIHKSATKHKFDSDILEQVYQSFVKRLKGRHKKFKTPEIALTSPTLTQEPPPITFQLKPNHFGNATLSSIAGEEISI